MTPLAYIVRTRYLHILFYADDTQLILLFSADPTSLKINFHNCMKNVADWMKTNCLKLNTDKIEVLFFGNKASPWNDTWWPTEL